MGKYIEVEDQVKLYVEDIGSGTPVIFIHRWPLNHKIVPLGKPVQFYQRISIHRQQNARAICMASGHLLIHTL